MSRDVCKVLNAPCSFGRVCESDPSFCPRYTNSLLSLTSNAYGRESVFVTAERTPDSNALHRSLGSNAFGFIICSLSVTGFVSPALGVACGL